MAPASIRDRKAGRRGCLAIVACALWLGAFELVPWIHVAFHESWGGHDHAEWLDQMVDEHTRHDEARCHEGHCHAAAPTSSDGRDEDRPVGPRRGHGRGSVAHHGIAVSPPPAAVPIVPDALTVETRRPDDRCDPVCDRPSATTRARAPPV